MRIYKLFALLLLMVGAPLYAQKKVSGRVSDEQGAPLIGTTVMVKGTTNAVSYTHLTLPTITAV